ncbi:MAG: DNA polymerase III subunit beta [Anaeroplasmataceae bacterium]
MNFKIDRNVLLENLNIVSRGLPSKTPMPILNGIKMEVTNKDIYLTSSNMDISIEVILSDSSLEIKEIGNVVVPGKLLIELVRKLNSKFISFNLIDNKILNITADRGEYKLNIMDVLDYPNINFINLDKPLSIQSKVIKNIVKETVFATSQNEKKPILTGVNFKLKDNVLKAVGTDSYRLSQSTTIIDKEFDPINITVPNKSLDELSKVIDNYNDVIDLYFSREKFLVKFKNIIFQARLLEGSFPETDRLVEVTSPISIIFNKDELLELVERVSILSPKDKEKELTYSIVKLEINKEKNVEIICNNSSVGDAKEEISPININCNETIKIGFSSKYLIEALRAFEEIEVLIELSSDTKPFIIKNNKNNDLIQIILPVRMD